MAIENVKVTEPGSGTAIAADVLSGGARVQFVKLMDGTDGSEVAATVTADNALAVDVIGIGAAMRCQEVTVNETGALLSALAGAYAGRRSLMLINTGTSELRLGTTNAAGCHWPLSPGVPFSYDWSDAIDPFIACIAGGTSSTLVVLETK